MNNSSNSPRWDKLPDAPHEFFELPEGYGRTDLKRSYFQLIKQFKPEKYPQEFQRIRAAFEQLDNQLRYGTQAVPSSIVLHEYTWDASNQAELRQRELERGAASNVENRNEGGHRTSFPLHQRLASESPESLYDEMKRLPEKRPFHFYALAVLSDVTRKKDSLAFVKWILEGLKVYPRDPALFQLLSATIRGPVRWKDVPAILNAISSVIRDDRFYYLTEPLWDQLLRDAPFQSFQKLLVKCERNLSDYQLVHKLTFYAHLLKAAIWTADREWVAEAFALLEEHHKELPPSIEFDIEVLFCLREYLRYRDEFLSAHPLRAQLDTTLRLYCTESPVEARNAFLTCQLRLVNSGAELLAAFPVVDRSPSRDAFISLWQLLHGEFGDRTDSEDDTSIGTVGVRQMLAELESKTNGSLLGKQWQWSGLCFLAGRCLSYVVVYLALYTLLNYSLGPNSSSGTWPIVICLIFAGLLGWLLNKYLTHPLWKMWCMHCAVACYSKIWRHELQQFMGRTYLPFRRMNLYLSHLDVREDELEYHKLVAAFSSNDIGLMMFSDAQTFVV